MTDRGADSRNDSEWPPKNNKRSHHVFTRREDMLIVDYLIEKKQFDCLGGNAVWKTMSRSREFNPAGRSFQGLRERFLKHIVKHLHLYSRVTPQIKARILKLNPKALQSINAMKSTKELKRDLEAAWGSEEEEEIVAENVPNNLSQSMTPVLLERRRLLEGQLTQKNLTSTPLEGVRDELPVSSEAIKAEEEFEGEAGEEELRDDSQLFSSYSAGGSSTETALEECRTTISLTAICPSLLFIFDYPLEDVNFSFRRLEALDGHRDVSYILQLLQNSLRISLEAHSQNLSVNSYACVNSSCDGTFSYFGLWEELGSYFTKIEKYQLRFDACYMKFFIRVMREILETPMCCVQPPKELPDFEVQDLYEYLCCNLAEPFRANLKAVQKLVCAVRQKSDGVPAPEME